MRVRRHNFVHEFLDLYLAISIVAVMGFVMTTMSKEEAERCLEATLAYALRDAWIKAPETPQRNPPSEPHPGDQPLEPARDGHD